MRRCHGCTPRKQEVRPFKGHSFTATDTNKMQWTNMNKMDKRFDISDAETKGVQLAVTKSAYVSSSSSSSSSSLSSSLFLSYDHLWLLSLVLLWCCFFLYCLSFRTKNNIPRWFHSWPNLIPQLEVAGHDRRIARWSPSTKPGILSLGGGNSNIFLCSPRSLGKWSNLTNIFQMGWNRQLVPVQVTRFFKTRPVQGFFNAFSVSFADGMDAYFLDQSQGTLKVSSGKKWCEMKKGPLVGWVI